MEAKRAREKSTLVAASAAAISLVLGDCDLLGEIFIRLGFATDLVRAAAVCRRWLRAASDPTFLRRFRDIHPPRLLGFYLGTFSFSTTSGSRRFVADYVPMLPQPQEVAAVVRRGRFGLDSYASQSTRVMDCRNGRVVVNLFRDGGFTYGVHSPLYPARGLVTFPRLPAMDEDKLYIFREILSKECSNGLSYFWFELYYSCREEIATAHVYKLQDADWSMQISATTKVLRLLASALTALSIVLVDDKIYMGITVHNILVLDLTSSTFSTIKYPIKYLNRRNSLVFDGEVMLSRANAYGVYLVHLNELQLRVWLQSGCNGNMGDWLLVKTICLRDLCANLKLSNSTAEDENDRDVYIYEVGDNAEFVFFQMHGCVLYLDIRSSALQKVYSKTEKDACVTSIHPYLMTWPPIFPQLKE